MFENELLENYYDARNSLTYKNSFDGFFMLRVAMNLQSKDFVTSSDFDEMVKETYEYCKNREERKQFKGMN